MPEAAKVSSVGSALSQVLPLPEGEGARVGAPARERTCEGYVIFTVSIFEVFKLGEWDTVLVLRDIDIQEHTYRVLRPLS